MVFIFKGKFYITSGICIFLHIGDQVVQYAVKSMYICQTFKGSKSGEVSPAGKPAFQDLFPFFCKLFREKLYVIDFFPGSGLLIHELLSELTDL